MVEVIWSDPALRRLAEITSYIAQFNPSAAERISGRLSAAGNSLADFPNRGRPAPHGSRELVTIPPYIIRYAVDGSAVTIITIYHGRQNR